MFFPSERTYVVRNADAEDPHPAPQPIPTVAAEAIAWDNSIGQFLLSLAISAAPIAPLNCGWVAT